MGDARSTTPILCKGGGLPGLQLDRLLTTRFKSIKNRNSGWEMSDKMGLGILFGKPVILLWFDPSILGYDFRPPQWYWILLVEREIR